MTPDSATPTASRDAEGARHRSAGEAEANVVIRASAGTGKTFQLSNRYLRLLNSGAPAEEILGTTFTRKAAGEILERILLRLAEAAVDEADCRELGKHIGDRKLTPSGSAKLLLRLTQQLHRVQVCTLDSFFANVSSSFALELGMPPGWQIVDELADRQLRLRAVDDVLSQGKRDDVARLMHLLTKGDADRNVTELLLSTVNSLYDVFRQTPAEAWRRFPDWRPLSEDELQTAVSALYDAPLPEHRSIRKIHDRACVAASEHEWEDFVNIGITRSVAEGRETYHRKRLGAELTAAYTRLLRHATAVVVSQLADQTEATRDFLERFHAVYARMKHDARGLRFEDVTHTLAAAMNRRDSSDGERNSAEAESFRLAADRIAYRMDARVSHLLLDEFQDTSLEQWQVLRPLAQRLTQPGEGDARQSFFCVGDVKQAIYGWRGGKAEIFEALTDELPGVQTRPLDCSYRSAPPIIDAVNQIFIGLLKHDGLEDYRGAVERWCNRFAEHTTARTGLAGYACLVSAPHAAEGVTQIDATLEFAADRIVQIVREAPGFSVGVLARRNHTVGRLIFELRRRGIAASEEGGNPLTDSAAVQLLTSLLRLADHPGHTAAAFHVAKSPLGPLVDLADYADAAAVEVVAENVRRELARDGYGPCIDRLARLLAPSCNHRDLRRLQQLVELAYGYQPNATPRPSDFVRYVEHESVADPTGHDVRVMTCHQAKGLQFDVVVLPELDAKLVGRPNSYVTGQPGPTRPIDRVCLHRNENIRNLLPEDLRDLFREAADQQIVEALCVLYVAVTRPVHALHMVVAPSQPTEQKLHKKSSGLLRAALTDGRPAEENAVLFEIGNPEWFRVDAPRPADPPPTPTADAPDDDDASIPPLRVQLAPMTGGRSRGLDRVAPSSREGSSRVRLANVLRTGNAAALDRGTLIHAWFELVRWLDVDGFPDEGELRRVAEELEAATHLDVDRCVADFQAMLRSPKIAWALMQKSHRPPRDLALPDGLFAGIDVEALRFEVHNERRFIVRENNAVVSGSIDRLVLIYHGLKLLAADVVDFKTDTLSADDPLALQEKVEFYRGQLETYRPAVAQLYALPLEHVSARLLMVGAGIVEPVSGGG